MTYAAGANLFTFSVESFFVAFEGMRLQVEVFPQDVVDQLRVRSVEEELLLGWNV